MVNGLRGRASRLRLSEAAKAAVSGYRCSVKCPITKAFFEKAWRKQTAIWKSLEAAFISPAFAPSGGVAAPVANFNRASRAKSPQRLHAVECERSLIAPQPGERPAKGRRNFPGCKALKSHKTAKALAGLVTGRHPAP
jgi:hypothetical protein